MDKKLALLYERFSQTEESARAIAQEYYRQREKVLEEQAEERFKNWTPPARWIESGIFEPITRKSKLR